MYLQPGTPLPFSFLSRPNNARDNNIVGGIYSQRQYSQSSLSIQRKEGFELHRKCFARKEVDCTGPKILATVTDRVVYLSYLGNNNSYCCALQNLSKLAAIQPHSLVGTRKSF